MEIPKVFDTNNLKHLLDNTIQSISSQGDFINESTNHKNLQESGENQTHENASSKNQINLSNLYNLLNDLINGQKYLIESVNDSNSRIENLENNVSIVDDNLRKIEKWTELDRKNKKKTHKELKNGDLNDQAKEEKEQITSPRERESMSSRPSSQGSTSNINNRRPLPPISKSTSDMNLSNPMARSSLLLKSAQSRMNYADKYDLKKLSTRLDLISTKVEKLSEVVPKNEEIIEKLESETSIQSDNSKGQPIQEAWSKLMLTKRIDANEESLEKFMQILDKLASDIDTIKNQISEIGQHFDEINGKMGKLNETLETMNDSASTGPDNEQLANDIKSQKDMINKTLKEIKDIMNKLKALEEAINNAGDVKTSDLNKVSDKLKKMSDTANNRINGLEDQLANLDAMTASLGNQMKNLERRKSVDSDKNGATEQELEPVSTGPDLETIKNLTEMRSRLSRLEPRVEDLETLGKELSDRPVANNNDSFDQDAFKLQLLSEMPQVIEQYLSDVLHRIQNLENDHEKLQDIIKYKLNNDNSSLDKNSLNDILSNYAEKDYLKQLLDEKSDYFDNLNKQVNDQIKQLHDQIGNNGKSLWSDIEKIKSQIDAFEASLADIRKKLLEGSFATGRKGMDIQDAVLGNVNTISPHIEELLNKLQKKFEELDENFVGQVNKLTVVDSKGNERSKGGC